MSDLKKAIMKRDDLTSEQADALIEDARNDMNERLANGELPSDICSEWFGLEPDYIMDLIG